jgi:2-oxoglutarate dehydrogenase E1 component
LTPLAHLGKAQGRFWIYDSPLSEYAALAFEYGYSVANKDALVAWEAQFGDFANGAQIIIDQFIAAGDDRWDQTSGLTLLLPHGYEGQGPEHSSARIERFLSLCAQDNLQVVNATTSAQYFHVLRRQARRATRRPLVVFTPKSLLRARVAHSPVTDLTVGSFQEVLDDTGAPPVEAVRRVLLASGKVAHEAIKHRDETKAPIAVVRVEQLYPWPGDQLAEVVARYERASDVVWIQEEPENMGPWPFLSRRVERLLAPGRSIRVVSRAESASPATGSFTVHKQEQQALIEDAFGGL